MTPIEEAIRDFARHIAEGHLTTMTVVDGRPQLHGRPAEAALRIIRLMALADARDGRFELLERRVRVAAQGGLPLNEDELAAVAAMSEARRDKPAHRPSSWRTDAKLTVAAAALAREIGVRPGVPLKRRLGDMVKRYKQNGISTRGLSKSSIYDAVKKLEARSSR